MSRLAHFRHGSVADPPKPRPLESLSPALTMQGTPSLGGFALIPLQKQQKHQLGVAQIKELGVTQVLVLVPFEKGAILVALFSATACPEPPTCLLVQPKYGSLKAVVWGGAGKLEYFGDAYKTKGSHRSTICVGNCSAPLYLNPPAPSSNSRILRRSKGI